MGQAGAARAEAARAAEVVIFGDSVTPEMEAQLSRRPAATQYLPDLAIVEVEGKTLYFSIPSGVDTGAFVSAIMTPENQDIESVGLEYTDDYHGNDEYGWVVTFTAERSPLGLTGLRAQLEEAPEGF